MPCYDVSSWLLLPIAHPACPHVLAQPVLALPWPRFCLILAAHDGRINRRQTRFSCNSHIGHVARRCLRRCILSVHRQSRRRAPWWMSWICTARSPPRRWASQARHAQMLLVWRHCLALRCRAGAVGARPAATRFLCFHLQTAGLLRDEQCSPSSQLALAPCILFSIPAVPD